MLGKLYDAVFGCWHHHYSFPITVKAGSRGARASSITGTYVVCLDCGRELPYDWEDMKVIGTASEERQYVQALATKEAA